MPYTIKLILFGLGLYVLGLVAIVLPMVAVVGGPALVDSLADIFLTITGGN